MIRRLSLAIGAASLALSMAATVTLAGNPAGTGQPSVACDDATIQPAGFSTDGFANAESRYANPDSQGGVSSGNWHVVSQYDVACYQVTLHH
jgi:hypothetical protein